MKPLEIVLATASFVVWGIAAASGIWTARGYYDGVDGSPVIPSSIQQPGSVTKSDLREAFAAARRDAGDANTQQIDESLTEIRSAVSEVSERYVFLPAPSGRNATDGALRAEAAVNMLNAVRGDYVSGPSSVRQGIAEMLVDLRLLADAEGVTWDDCIRDANELHKKTTPASADADDGNTSVAPFIYTLF